MSISGRSVFTPMRIICRLDVRDVGFSPHSGVSADDVAADCETKPMPQVPGDALLSDFQHTRRSMGLGYIGSFKLIVEDRGNLGLDTLQQMSDEVVGRGQPDPRPDHGCSLSQGQHPLVLISTSISQQNAGGRPVESRSVFDTLQIYLGSYYVNNFIFLRSLLAGQRHGRSETSQ